MAKARLGAGYSSRVEEVPRVRATANGYNGGRVLEKRGLGFCRA